MAILPARVNETWVNVAGEAADPRFVFVFDRGARNFIRNLNDVGFDSRDQVVQFSVGLFENVTTFFVERARLYAKCKAIIFAWIGQEELSQWVPPGPQSAAVRAYFHPQGPQIYPLHPVNTVVDRYAVLVTSVAEVLPLPTLVTTEPAPRRSAGYANWRAKDVGLKMRKVIPNHRHAVVGKGCVGRRSSKNGADAVGGRWPLVEDKFADDGITPLKDTFVFIVQRLYGALAHFVGEGLALGDQFEFVKPMF